ncbi:hypothetical protein [Streptomyces sp. NPDC031705]|uniref:hypothetical protein n=1 Tax=Streptomyces sp. NPDC031705 TaxID=3155729 RepID=UPI0033C4BDBB
MPETTTLPLAPMTPDAAISAFSYLHAVQAGERSRPCSTTSTSSSVIRGSVPAKIVVPVTALPGPEAGAPTTQMFALEALGRVLVATLRT